MNNIIIFFILLILFYSSVYTQNNIYWNQSGNLHLESDTKIYVNILCNSNQIITKKRTDGNYKIIDLKSYNLIDAFKEQIEFDYLILSPDEKYYVNSRLEVFEFENNNYLRTLDTTGIDIWMISDLQFSKNGKYIFFYSNQIKVFDFNTGKLIFDHYNENGVLDVQIKKNDELIYLDEIGELITYNLISGEKISQINPTSFYYDGYLSLSKSDSLIALTDNEHNNIWVININQNKIIDSIKTESDTRAVFSNDDSILIYSDMDGLIFRKLEDGEIINRVSCPYQPTYIEKSNCGEFLILHNLYQPIIDVFDLIKNELHPIVCHSGMLHGLAFSKDSRYLYTFEDGIFGVYIQKFDIIFKKREWMSTIFKEQDKENKFYRHFYPFVLSPDNNNIAVCGQLDSFPIINIFDLKNLSGCPPFLSGHKKAITSLTFSKDEKYLASGGLDSTIYIWDVPNLLLF